MTQTLLPLLTFAALAASAAEPAAVVRIAAPRDGAVITTDSLHVVLSASGIEIVAAHGPPTPGRHRVIAVLAPGNHVPLEPWVTDSVYFTVQPTRE